jgi:hypothetical protein
MNRITFPLKSKAQGPPVADLIDALSLLLTRSLLSAADDPARRGLLEALARDRATPILGDGTALAVKTFQHEQSLPPTGEVDERTATLLNAFLARLSQLGGPTVAAPPRSLIVNGQVRAPDGSPMRGVLVRATDEIDPSPVRLGEDTTDADGRYTIRYQTLPGIDATNLRVAAIDPAGTELHASDVVKNPQPLELIDLALPAVPIPSVFTVSGLVTFDNGVPAGALSLRLFRRDFGGSSTKLQEGTTDANGNYTLTYNRPDTALSLEIRTADAAGKDVILTTPLNDLDPQATVNLIAPSTLRPAIAEYQRMVADLSPRVGSIDKLATAQETDTQQDLTVLNLASGWDARLIALAATTERLGADPSLGLSKDAVYGLLRAGLPSDKTLLAKVSPDDAAQALKASSAVGVVSLNDQQIADAKTAFTKFRTDALLDTALPGSQGSYRSLLSTSGLNLDAQAKFASIYFDHDGDAKSLWASAKTAGLTDAQVQGLQLQGKLAFLAGNSVPMTQRLMTKTVGGQALSDPAQLVDLDLHQPDQWVTEVLAQAGVPRERLANLTDDDKRKLGEVIPAAYTAEQLPDQLQAFADDKARQIRRSYPTHVLGRLLETDAKFQLPDAHTQTMQLLKNATKQGFRLGQANVSTFLKNNPGVTAGLLATDIPRAAEQLTSLHRVFQISPMLEAVPVLMNMGMKSAFDVVGLDKDRFLEDWARKYFEHHNTLPPPELGRFIHLKSSQVSSITYNFFASAQQIATQPALAAIGGTPHEHAAAKQNLKDALKDYPTIQSLFGSQDYCECEHCRSVLSPAAYFVDLLQFIDLEPTVWGNFLAHWRTTHNGQEYPHYDAAGHQLKPYDVLVQRRPDLPNIALTCENTLTAMPYIDLVNEILEYAVANSGRLGADAAHDTGDSQTPDLLAEPQNIVTGAYEILRGARYPMNLPFDLWLETGRVFTAYFGTLFHQLLETVRPSDLLLAPAQPFDRAAIFFESLGLSPDQMAILTNPDPLSSWHVLYGYDTLGAATTPATDPVTGERLDLNSAKALSRRLGVTYKELAQLLQTAFVNPRRDTLFVLGNLNISVQDARLYQQQRMFYDQNKDLIGKDRATLSAADQARFDALASPVPPIGLTGWDIVNECRALEDRLTDLAGPPGGAAAGLGTTYAQLQAAVLSLPYNRLVVLADPVAGCDFDQTIVRYADGTAADAPLFLRLNMFVRLWRVLGWPIEELDEALRIFIPRSAPFDDKPANLQQLPLRSALIVLAHLKALDERLKVGKRNRLRLLTFWSDIPSAGPGSLYAQMFLTPAVLKASPAFDDPLGRYLTNPAAKVKEYALALQGALGLSPDDLARILADSGTTPEQADLSMAHVSNLYRHAALSKGLKLPVRQILALKRLSGLDPFQPLPDAPLQTIEQDGPFTQTIRFVELADEIKQSGLSIDDLDYLFSHQFDPAGPYRPTPEITGALLLGISRGVRAIRTEHAVPVDPGTLTDDVLRQKLGLALSADVVDRLLSLMNGTAEFAGVALVPNSTDQLSASTFTGDTLISRVTYDTVRGEQTLVVRGVVNDTQKADLAARFKTVLTPTQQAVLSTLLDKAQAEANRQVGEFFLKYLDLASMAGTQPTGFLNRADFDSLCSALPAVDPTLIGAPADAARQNVESRRRAKLALLASTFFPFLQRRLTRKLVVDTLCGQIEADAALVESLLTDAGVLHTPDNATLLDAFASVGALGVTAAFYDSSDLSGPLQPGPSLAPSADVALKSSRDAAGNPLNPAGSATFRGFLEVPEAGAYRFFIELEKQNAAAVLRFDHLPNPVFLNGAAPAAQAVLGAGPGQFLDLQPGTTYRFSLELRKLSGGNARLLVQGPTLPKDSLSQLTLTPADSIDGAGHALIALRKATQLVQALGLTTRETDYLAAHGADFANWNLSALPTDPALPGTSRALFASFIRVVAYSRLKNSVAGGSDDLIGVFEANAVPDMDRAFGALAIITRRDQSVVQAAAQSLLAAPSFPNEINIARLWDALQIAERMGVPVASFSAWSRLVSPGATGSERFTVVRDLKAAIKARLDDEGWRRVAQATFDPLRRRQRDALASYTMILLKLDSIERLYEYFLIDPGMEPVVQTSRLRLAISSVQLFIQRCLLNLERDVSPSAVDSKQWEWMKRYRVWEANRKIFLFPENWLEPEFRDDKTNLFSELEGTLVQGDVSDDLVEDAFLTYLKKLEGLARLDIRAMHAEDPDDPANRILHVFGRTYNHPHKYFYRRYSHEAWTAWEPVTVEIDGDHLAPVVWRGRLFLFWVTFVDRPNSDARPGAGPSDDNKERTVKDLTLTDFSHSASSINAQKNVEAHLHWAEHLQGEWSTHESAGPAAVLSEKVQSGPAGFNQDDIRLHVSKKYNNAGDELGVFIAFNNTFTSFYLEGRNSAPREDLAIAPPSDPFGVSESSSDLQLTVNFTETIETTNGATIATTKPHVILNKVVGLSLLHCNGDVSLGAPNTGASPSNLSSEAQSLVGSGTAEIAALIKPVFYQDSLYTLFVQPNVTEHTVEEFDGWVYIPPPGGVKLPTLPPGGIHIVPSFPVKPGSLPHKPWEIPFDPVSITKPNQGIDWLANPVTALRFGGQVIGPAGGIDLTRTFTAPSMSVGAGVVTPPAFPDIARGGSVAVTAGDGLERGGLSAAVGRIAVVGGSGLGADATSIVSDLRRNNIENIRTFGGSGAIRAGLGG